jgi:hypothetical protein
MKRNRKPFGEVALSCALAAQGRKHDKMRQPRMALIIVVRQACGVWARVVRIAVYNYNSYLDGGFIASWSWFDDKH